MFVFIIASTHVCFHSATLSFCMKAKEDWPRRSERHFSRLWENPTFCNHEVIINVVGIV